MFKFIFPFVFLASFFFVSTSLSAQPVDAALGLRIGSANGISYLHFLPHTNLATEGLLVYRRSGIRAIGFLVQYIPLGGSRTSSFFYLGAGSHVGVNGLLSSEKPNIPAYGIDGMIGLAYVFPHSPCMVSFDLKPMLELHQGRVFSGNNAGFTLRWELN